MDLKLIYLTLTTLLFITILSIKNEDNKKICNTIDIKNTRKKPWNQLSDCTRINGSLRIFLIENQKRQRLDNISFPLLEVITDYLLIYRIFNVTTLENWFPNLKYIGGAKLIDDNALIVKDVPDLRRLGFHNLKRIRGGVLLENVNNLCFAQTSDYRVITEATKPSSPMLITNNRQILTGFNVSAPNSNELSVEWDYTPSIENISIDYYLLKLIEFQDLEFYYQRFDKFNSRTMCSSKEDNKFTDGQHFDEYFVCSDTKHEEKLKDKCFNRFVFQTIEYELDRDCSTNQSFDKLLDKFIYPIVYKSNNIRDNKLPQNLNNGIPYKEIPFDPEYYHIYKVINSTIINERRLSGHKNITAYKLEGLKNFQYYYAIVYACSSSICRIVAHKKTRTPPFEKGDEIIEESVNYVVKNTKIFIYWSEPTKPNGAIISYQIHLVEVLSKTNKKTICLNRTKFKKINGYIIEDLERNKEYSFRLRAVSMNGPSNNWTKDYYFRTTNFGTHEVLPEGPETSVIVFTTIILTEVLVLLIVCISFICYLKKLKTERDYVLADPIKAYRRALMGRNNRDMFHVLGDRDFYIKPMK